MTYSIGREEKKQEKYITTKCYYKSALGVKCPQKGVKMDENFYNALYNTIINNYRQSKVKENEKKKKKHKRKKSKENEEESKNSFRGRQLI